MRNRLVMFSGILILSALATPLGIQAGGGDDSGVHTVEISAKKYEFTPNVIRVKAGERVLESALGGRAAWREAEFVSGRRQG